MPAVEKLKRDAAEASGLEKQTGMTTLSGTAFIHGAHQKFTLSFDGDSRCRMDITGPVIQRDGFDGKISWTEGPCGAPHKTYSRDRDSFQLLMAAIDGTWAKKDGFIISSPDPKGQRFSQVIIRLKGGVFEATLDLGHQTSLPYTLKYWSPEGERVCDFSGYKDFGDRTFPTHVVVHASGQDDIFDIQAATPGKEDKNSFTEPPADPSLFRYDPTVSPDVEVKRVAGYMFVHPKVNGQDVGWFFLDSGADVMCIDPTVSAKLGLAPVGSDTTAGVVAVSQLKLVKGENFTLGPATLKNVTYLEFDLSDIAKSFGIQVGGVCGYDFFARTILDIDPNLNTLKISDPAASTSAKPGQTHIRFIGNTPLITASYSPAYRGEFHLDTGSDSTVDFFSGTVNKYHLMQGVAVKPAQTGGAGGSNTSYLGPIDWFELGGTRISSPTVGFQVATSGVFSSTYEDGNIGMGFLGKFHLVFDYPHESITFEKP